MKVYLDADKSAGYGHLLTCCDKRQPVPVEELEERDAWHCAYCNKPLMVMIEGAHYIVGENISI